MIQKRKLNKTETKLLQRLSERGGRCGVEGVREINAAKKLHDLGLVEFKSDSRRVLPHESNCRRRNGDYVGFFYYGGQIRTI